MEAWLQAHETYRVPLHSSGELDVRASAGLQDTALGERSHQDSLYVPVRQEAPLQSLYIGKTKQLLQWWPSHMRGVQSRQGTYAR